MSVRIALPEDKIRDFCARRHIRSLALFGSVLRDDFRRDSDLDFLVDFEPDARVSLFDVVTMQSELEDLFGRKVDLVELKGLRNPYRRHEILRTREVIYDGS